MRHIHYLLVFYYVENLYILYHCKFLFWFWCIYHYTLVHYLILLIKLLILFHILKYIFSIFSSLTKWFRYLLFLSKYFVFAFIWGSFMHNGEWKGLPLCLYPISHLNKSWPYDFIWKCNFFNVYFVNINSFLFLWKRL